MKNLYKSKLLTLLLFCSSLQTVFTQVNKPTGLTVTSSTCTSVSLSWNPDATVNGWNVSENHDYVTTVFTNSVTLDYSAAETGNSYSYKIQAFNNSDPNNTQYSPSSDLVFATLCTPNVGPNPAVGNLPSTVTGNYNLVFQDEFSDGQIDATKWQTQYRWGPNIIINNEDQYYVDQLNDQTIGWEPFSFNNDILTIQGDHKPAGFENFFPEQEYFSGVLTSVENFTYGYYEVRAKLPAGKGLWPAFWLLNSFEGNPPVREIDIMEFTGGDRTAIFNNYHYSELSENNPNNSNDPNWDPIRCHKVNTRQVHPDDFTSTFHTFGVEWTENFVAWYIDGELQQIVEDDNCDGILSANEFNNKKDNYSGSFVSDQTMYILLNLAIGSTNLGTGGDGPPDSNTSFPAHFEIDYVRVYQKTTEEVTNSIAWNQVPTSIVNGVNTITIDYDINEDGLVLIQLFNDSWNQIGESSQAVSIGSGTVTIQLTPDSPPTETVHVQAKLRASDFSLIGVIDLNETITGGTNSLLWSPAPSSIHVGNNDISLDYTIDQSGWVVLQLFDENWNQVSQVDISVSMGSDQVTLPLIISANNSTVHYLQAKLLDTNLANIIPPSQLNFGALHTEIGCTGISKTLSGNIGPIGTEYYFDFVSFMPGLVLNQNTNASYYVQNYFLIQENTSIELGAELVLDFESCDSDGILER